MFAFRVWILIASSALLGLAAAAGPLTAEDVRQEKQAISQEICFEKAHIYPSLQATGSALARWVLLSGTSTIQNKLSAVDSSTVVFPREERFGTLGSKLQSFSDGVSCRRFYTHFPENGYRNVLDAKGTPNPERYLPQSDLAAGVNVLVRLKTIQAPVCLSAAELEEYIHLRVELKIKPGNYWAYLHLNKLNDEQLALLRYYDYLDTSAPKRPVAVYRCSELIARGKH
jgi:hypothetical protein